MKQVALILLSSFLLFTGCKKDTPVNRNNSMPVANAGASQTIILPVNSVALFGTGTSDNGAIVGYSWNLVSGPNVPVITYPVNQSTNVTGMIAGTYIFQFAVTDTIGLTGTDSVSVIVLPAGTSNQTLTLQPSNNNMEWHFWGNSTQNQSGHATQLDAGTWTNAGEIVYVRGAVKFDFSSIPSSATILSASLSLYSTPNPLDGNLTDANSGSDNSMFVRMISSNWTAAGSTWANQPSTTTVNEVSVPHTANAFQDVLNIDVKDIVNAMRSTNNYGFMISLQNENVMNIRQFCSSMHADASKHPKLVITYQ
jgi:hypothetical protein